MDAVTTRPTLDLSSVSAQDLRAALAERRATSNADALLASAGVLDEAVSTLTPVDLSIEHSKMTATHMRETYGVGTVDLRRSEAHRRPYVSFLPFGPTEVVEASYHDLPVGFEPLSPRDLENIRSAEAQLGREFGGLDGGFDNAVNAAVKASAWAKRQWDLPTAPLVALVRGGVDDSLQAGWLVHGSPNGMDQGPARAVAKELEGQKLGAEVLFHANDETRRLLGLNQAADGAARTHGMTFRPVHEAAFMEGIAHAGGFHDFRGFREGFRWSKLPMLPIPMRVVV